MDVPPHTTSDDIIEKLLEKHGENARRLMYYPDGGPCFLVTVNNQVARDGVTLNENDHLKILGLFSGG